MTEIEDTELPREENAVPVKQMQGEALIAMAAEMMKRSLVKEGIIVPAFSTD